MQVTAAAWIRGKTTAAVATAGALVFVGSLLYGAWSYAWRFGHDTRAASTADLPAVAFDLLLFTAFALHHSVFARRPVRQRVATLVSPPLERSAYVWISSVLFVLVLAAWRPVGGTLWRASGPFAIALAVLQLAGVAITLRAAGALDVLALAGLRQALDGPSRPPPILVESGLYGIVRHPLYFGWALMVWATPAMTGTRLVLAAVSTLYLVLAIPLEERALRREFGEAYGRYTARVRWRMLWGIY